MNKTLSSWIDYLAKALLLPRSALTERSDLYFKFGFINEFDSCGWWRRFPQKVNRKLDLTHLNRSKTLVFHSCQLLGTYSLLEVFLNSYWQSKTSQKENEVIMYSFKKIVWKMGENLLTKVVFVNLSWRDIALILLYVL